MKKSRPLYPRKQPQVQKSIPLPERDPNATEPTDEDEAAEMEHLIEYPDDGEPDVSLGGCDA